MIKVNMLLISRLALQRVVAGQVGPNGGTRRGMGGRVSADRGIGPCISIGQFVGRCLLYYPLFTFFVNLFFSTLKL